MSTTPPVPHNAVRQVLCNELGLTPALVREIVAEKVGDYIARRGGFEVMVRTIAREEIAKLVQEKRHDWRSVSSIVADEARKVIAPVVEKAFAKVLG